MATGGSVCRFYNSPGGCWYGDNCRFIHDSNLNNSAQQPRHAGGQRCRFYLTPAGCRFGDHCIFAHGDEQVVNLLVSRTDEESEPLLFEKHEQETPEKSGLAFPSDSESPESGTVFSGEDAASGAGNWREGVLYGSEEEDEEDEEGDCRGDYSSLWSEDSDPNKKKWETMKSEKKDRIKPEVKEAVCGECGELFESDDAFELLRAHYMEQFKKFNYAHLKFLNKHHRFDHTTCCMICDKLFGRSKDLLRHIVDKSKQPTEDGEEHQIFIDVGVVLPFCYRDTVDHDNDKLMEELFLSLVHTYDGSDTDTEDEDFLNFMGLAHMLTKMPHAHILNMGEVDTSSNDSDYGGMCGFSEDDCYELACQGIKPWDPEAGAALAVLNGFYD